MKTIYNYPLTMVHPERPVGQANIPYGAKVIDAVWKPTSEMLFVGNRTTKHASGRDYTSSCFLELGGIYH